MNTTEKVRDTLLHLKPENQLPEDVRQAAFAPIQRMRDWSQ